MNAGFLDFVDRKRWLLFQDYFSQILHAAVRVVDVNGAPLTRLSNPHPYCFEVISSSGRAFSTCEECLLFNPKPHSQDSLLVKKEHFLDVPGNIAYDTCPFYGDRIIIPIRTATHAVCAHIVIGPLVLGKRRSYPEYFNLGRNLELGVGVLIEGIEQVKVFSFNAIKPLTCLFQEIANFMVENGTGAMEEQTHLKKTQTSKEWAVPFYIFKMLQALFETAGEGIDAERGSIMLFDENKKILFIALAKGIPVQIVQDARVKFGEGLAGWAARENKVLFINEDFQEQHVSNRLHQPQLKASLIVPITSGNCPLGVLCLSTQKKIHKFNKENINSIVHLAKMVDSVLYRIKRDTP